MMKKLASIILTAVLLTQILVISAFAAGVTLSLSADSGYIGNSVTISGNYTPNKWVTVKVIDKNGNIVFIEPKLTANDGAFSTVFIVPSIETGTLTIMAGSGADVASKTFTVKEYVNISGSDDSAESKGGESIKVSGSEGHATVGTRSDTESGKKVEIPRENFNFLAGAGSGRVTIDAGIATVTFNGRAMNNIRGNSDSGNISLTVKKVNPLSFSAEARRRVGERPVYDFSLMAGKTRISNFGGVATVSVAYEIAADEDPNAIVVYYVEDNGALTPVRGRYDAKTKTAKFTVTHFSYYAVGYNKVSFTDVSQNAWFFSAVTFCAAREITLGTGGGGFSPDMSLTRGQFIVMLMRTYGLAADKASADNFDDAGNTYYTGYLAAAKRLGITNGVGNNLFAPTLAITRQDMFVLLYRALESLGELPQKTGTASLSVFSDASDISDYAVKPIDTLSASGVISGSDGKLYPLRSSTRAEMAQVLYNLMSK